MPSAIRFVQQSLVNFFGMESPSLANALAIADHVLQLI
jgi:L-2-hydroxyglutarate oxidase LhgO